jgi:NAD(P)-dependent dehydrogenase (short-subunit alcohol dehydrogenase family)
MNDRLRGHRVLVTGAANGIGEATARQLHAVGARLALLDLDDERLDRLADELGALPLVCDVADECQTRRAVDAAARHLGGLDTVVANAGIHIAATTDVITPEDFRRVIEVDLLGVWHTLRPAISHVAVSRGYLLSVSSLAATLHLPTLGSYSAAKAGVHALADVMRLELRGLGIAVGCAYFGVVDTALTRQARRRGPKIPAHSYVRTAILRPITAERAARGVLDAIRHRARWIVRPRYILPLIALPSSPQLLLDGIGALIRTAATSDAEAS